MISYRDFKGDPLSVISGPETSQFFVRMQSGLGLDLNEAFSKGKPDNFLIWILNT